MKKFAFVLPNGVVSHTATPAMDEMYVDGEVYNEVTAREIPVTAVDADVLNLWHWADNGWQVRPARPSPNHVWDSTAKAWKGDIEKVLAQKKLEIEAERDRRLSYPEIIYDGKRLDADLAAKQNLQDKITAVNSRMSKGSPTPQQMLVWRDRDNVVHSFATMREYKDWLDGFVVALENRGMQVWGWSWSKKDQLKALKTFEEVEAFNPVE